MNEEAKQRMQAVGDNLNQRASAAAAFLRCGRTMGDLNGAPPSMPSVVMTVTEAEDIIRRLAGTDSNDPQNILKALGRASDRINVPMNPGFEHHERQVLWVAQAFIDSGQVDAGSDPPSVVYGIMLGYLVWGPRD